MKRLLVNADDLGLSSAINSGIIHAHVHGIVTSTSLVAAGRSFEQAVELARLYPDLGVGVHLTLVEEEPVSNSLAVLPRTYGELMKKIMNGQIRLSQIEREFRAQIEKCLAAGIQPTHLDSHQHTHALPLIFPIALRLANEYSIPGIRIPRGIPAFRDRAADRFLGKCALCLFAHADALFPRGRCKATDRMVGLFDEKVPDILNGLRAGSSELVCHPAFDDATPRYARWNQRRQMELASLTSETVKEAVLREGIQLIHYRQL